MWASREPLPHILAKLVLLKTKTEGIRVKSGVSHMILSKLSGAMVLLICMLLFLLLISLLFHICNGLWFMLIFSKRLLFLEVLAAIVFIAFYVFWTIKGFYVVFICSIL